MAIFGFHLVLTLVAATVFSKLTARFSLCNWAVFKGLHYFLVEGSLLPKQPIAPSNGKQQRRKKQGNEGIQILRSDLKLIRLPLTAEALQGVPFFTSLGWTFNYFAFALAVYTISEVFIYLLPNNPDKNTSLTWIICSIAFLLHSLCKLTLMKMTPSELSAERNLILCFAALSFPLSMLAFIFGDRFMDIGFQQGYREMATSLNQYLSSQGFDLLFDVQEKSPLVLVMAMSLLFSLVAATLLFPSIQYSSTYLDAATAATSPLLKALLHSAFFLPVVSLLLYSRHVSTHLLEHSLLSPSQLDALRVLCVVGWAGLRCLAAPAHLQAFLDQPRTKILELNNSGGAMKSEEKQRRIAYYASYTCVTALQYYVPVFLTLSVALLLKSFGDVHISSLWQVDAPPTIDTAPATGNSTLPFLLATSVQRPFWALCLTTLLGIQCALTLLGVASKKAFASRM